jgi:hypothetical protein
LTSNAEKAVFRSSLNYITIKDRVGEGVIVTAQPETIRNEAEFDEDNPEVYYMKVV